MKRAGLAILALAAAAGGDPTAASEAQRLSLRVSVAASLAPAIREAVDLYRFVEPGVDLRLASGESGGLLQQVQSGVPADLLIGAATDEIDRLVAARLALEPTRRRIAANRLVLIVPRGAAQPAALDDLARPEFELVAIGDPERVSVGRYARDALTSRGLWERLEPRLVLTRNARQLLEHVSRGDVSAGLLYSTDALLFADRVTVGPEIPLAWHAPIFHEGVVLARAAQPEAAAAFLLWLGSEAGRAPLVRRGFLIPR